MKRRIAVWTAVILALALAAGAGLAEGVDFDVYRYSYEELNEIRQLVDRRIEEMNREYAVEHADRSIAFDITETILFPGELFRAVPTVTPLTEEAPGQTKIVWSSSNPDIAKVFAKGLVKVTGTGDAVITATAQDNEYLSASYVIHCAVPVEQVTVWGQTEPLVVGLDPGATVTTLGVSIEPEDAYYQGVVWSSSDETIATVDENGQVTGLAPGRVTITAKSTEDSIAHNRPEKTGTFEVQVNQGVTGLALAEETVQIDIGKAYALTAMIEPENATNRQLAYTSDNPEVATVDGQGTITPTGTGTCIITCETTDGSGLTAACSVTVTKPVTAVALPATELSMAVGSVYKAEAVLTPEDATNPALLWTSSNVYVARVADGTIEAVGQGECEVTCITMDGSNLSATIKVKVPTFSVGQTEYTVTEKTGLEIPVSINVSGAEVNILCETDCFTWEDTGSGKIRISPVSAGEAVMTLENPAAPEDTVAIRIAVENSAVFNQASYPAVPYTELVTMPDRYENAQISLYGKILNITKDEEGTQTLAIGTAGDGYTDRVLAVRCGAELLPEGTEAGRMITVYGLFHTERTYSEALQAETQVPVLTAEKVVPDVISEAEEATAEEEGTSDY